MYNPDDFGDKLSAARQGRGLTQAALARSTKIYQSVISDLESGKRQPTFVMLVKLATALKVPIQWFLTGSDYVGSEISDISIQLQFLGIVDLHVENEHVPGAFRTDEDVMAIAVSGNVPSPRIIEAMPAVLAWNMWKPALLLAFAKERDTRASIRLAWIADIVLTIHRNQEFPGDCKSTKSLEDYIGIVSETKPITVDTMGLSAGDEPLPPVSRRWKIQYPSALEKFRERANRLQRMRAGILSRALRAP